MIVNKCFAAHFFFLFTEEFSVCTLLNAQQSQKVFQLEQRKCAIEHFPPRFFDETPEAEEHNHLEMCVE